MLPPAGITQLGRSPLDLIIDRTTHRKECPNSFVLCGVLGTWAVVLNAPCGRWSCAVCGERLAENYSRIAYRGCGLATERIRLLTISCPREMPAESWRQLPQRWDRFSKRLGRRLTSSRRSWSYFATVELQRRGNPHLHVLMRDSGYLKKEIVHALGYACGFGFSDIRQIGATSGAQYVTKYLTKSAGQEMPKGTRRVRRSRDWLPEDKPIVSSWGEGWCWENVEGLDADYLDRKLAEAGILRVFRYSQRPEGGD